MIRFVVWFLRTLIWPPSPWRQCHAPTERERLASWHLRMARHQAAQAAADGERRADLAMRLGQFSYVTDREALRRRIDAFPKLTARVSNE
jgi:hypothetical protein